MYTIDKPFAYGVSVSGDNFTDRKTETRNLVMNFTHGVNTILISPRRMGKTSLVHRAIEQINDDNIIPVFLDVYDCRDEYDFYNKFSEEIIRASSSTVDAALRNVAEFIGRISPKISVSPDLVNEYSISLGLTPKQIRPEEILALPEMLAKKRDKHLLICIDEFQQIGEFADSLTVQKKMRGVWQLQKNVSYCLFGSKKHMLENIFQNKRMPFYQFGQMMYLGKIDQKDWVEYVTSRFEACGKKIPPEISEKLCQLVECYSSYVQQLAWNLFVETDSEATSDGLKTATDQLLAQNNSFFTEQIRTLTSYQMNFLKAVCSGLHSGFTSEKVLSEWNIGTKSNISVIKESLLKNELIEERGNEIWLADPVFRIWLEGRS